MLWQNAQYSWPTVQIKLFNYGLVFSLFSFKAQTNQFGWVASEYYSKYAHLYEIFPWSVHAVKYSDRVKAVGPCVPIASV